MRGGRDPRRDGDLLDALTPAERQIADDLAGRYAALAVLMALGVVLLCVILLAFARGI